MIFLRYKKPLLTKWSIVYFAILSIQPSPRAVANNAIGACRENELGKAIGSENSLVSKALSVQSMDQEYANLSRIAHDPKGTIKAAGVHVLLNRALYPMIADLRTSVLALKDADIDLRLENLNRSRPIGYGQYIKSTARLDDLNGLSGRNYDVIIDHNSKRGYDFYGFEQSLPLAASRLVWSKPNDAISMPSFIGLVGKAITPIGAYGEGFAIAMQRTTQILIDDAISSLSGKSEKIYKLNRKLFSVETTRGKVDTRSVDQNDRVPLDATIEGIVTLNQLLSTILTEKVVGIESGTEAVRKFIFHSANPNGLTNEYTRRVNMMFTGPASLTGRAATSVVVLQPDGNLDFSQSFKALLKSFKSKSKRVRSVCPLASIFQDKTVFAGSNPASLEYSKKTGIQLLAETYWKVFERVSRDMGLEH